MSSTENRRKLNRFVAAVSVVLGCTASTAAAADEPSDAPDLIEGPQDQARALHHEAKMLLGQGEIEAALPLLERAYGLHKSYDIVGNLGATLLDLGRPVEAARKLMEADAALPTHLEPEKEARFREVLKKARSQVGMALVTSTEGEMTLYVDGEAVGPLATGGNPRPIIVEPGEHRFEGRRDDARTAEVVRDLPAGKEIVIKLGTLQSPAQTPSPDDSTDAAAIGFGVGLGIGAAGAIVGAVLLGLSASKSGEADDLLAQIRARSGAGSCPGGDAACGTLRDTLSSKDTLFNAGLPLIISGGVLAVAGGVGLAITLADDDDAEVQAAPIVGPGFGGLGLGGRF